MKHLSPVPFLAIPCSSTSPISRSIKVTSPLFLTKITVDTRVPYHLPPDPASKGTNGFCPIRIGFKHVHMAASANDRSGIVCLKPVSLVYVS